jgi:hypothetical protein
MDNEPQEIYNIDKYNANGWLKEQQRIVDLKLEKKRLEKIEKERLEKEKILYKINNFIFYPFRICTCCGDSIDG